MFFTSAIFKTLATGISVSTNSFAPAWSQVDFSEYALPGHYLKTKNDQAVDPSQADINCNLESYWSQYKYQQVIYKLGSQLDHKYYNFLRKYKLGEHLFQNITSNPDYDKNFEIFFIDEDQGNKVKRLWNPEKELFPLQVGEWKSYNLVFKNLLNNTSFSFSINFTNFDLKRGDDGKGEINFADFGKLPFLHHDYALYSAGEHIRTTNTLKVNLADKILKLKNQEDWVAVDSFFLKPISYDYTAQVYEHDDGCDERIDKQNRRGKWTWSDLEYDHVDVRVYYIGVNKRCSVFDECPIPEPHPHPHPPDAPPKMYAKVLTDHYHESNNTLVFEGVGRFWSNKYDWPYGHHPWHVIPYYQCRVLKTGYRDVFQNNPYELSEAHGEAKKLLSNLTNRSFNCLLGNDDLSKEAVQKTIKTNFNEVNHHFFHDINHDSKHRKIEIIKRDQSGARIDYHLIPYQYNQLQLMLLLFNSQWEIDIQVYYKPIA